MHWQPTLSIKLPYDSPGKYFSIRLKSSLTKEPCEYPMTKKLLVVSEIDGNFQAFQRLLIRQKVIDKKHKWLYEEGHLVIVGNCLGKKEQIIECLWFIYALEEKAKHDGGYVHFILGDVEIANMHKNWQSQHPAYASATKSGRPLTALFDGNRTIGTWLRTKNIMEKIGNILFVHGGISPDAVKITGDIYHINRIAGDCYDHPAGNPSDITKKLLYYGEHSPLRYNGYLDGLLTETDIDRTLSAFGVSHIVTGHAQKDNIEIRYSGKVISLNLQNNINTCSSLLIEQETFYNVNRGGQKVQVWPSEQ